MMVPFSVGLGPQRGCQIAPPKKYLKTEYLNNVSQYNLTFKTHKNCFKYYF